MRQSMVTTLLAESRIIYVGLHISETFLSTLYFSSCRFGQQYQYQVQASEVAQTITWLFE